MTSEQALRGAYLMIATGLIFWPLAGFSQAPGWEPDFGAELATLMGADDSAENAVLSFEFPFAGSSYTVVSANTNGGLALGNDPGIANIIHWHVWHKNAFQLDFTSAPFPSLLAFNTDLDLTSVGTMYFNDFGDRAVFTWDGVATNRSPQLSFATFQIALYPDGKFSYSYLPLGGDLIADLDEGIVVGYSRGQGEVPAGSSDYSATPMSALSTHYQIWCYNEDLNVDPAVSGCFEPGQDNNAAFDLANNLTLLFEPDGSGGYLISNQPQATPPPLPPLPSPVEPISSGGGAVGVCLLGLMLIFLGREARSGKALQRARIRQGSHRA